MSKTIEVHMPGDFVTVIDPDTNEPMMVEILVTNTVYKYRRADGTPDMVVIGHE